MEYRYNNNTLCSKKGLLVLISIFLSLNIATAVAQDAPPVNVALYYDSLSPDSKKVIITQIAPTYAKLASSGILNLELVPYGNSQEKYVGGQWYFQCQGGATECLGNRIHSCAIHYNSLNTALIPFETCLMHYGSTMTNAKYCADVNKLEYTQIESCVNGSKGSEVQHEMALKTLALNPSHAYVPWFTLNGYHTDEIQSELSNNMLEYVCYRYTGIKPAACNN